MELNAVICIPTTHEDHDRFFQAHCQGIYIDVTIGEKVIKCKIINASTDYFHRIEIGSPMTLQTEFTLRSIQFN